MQPQRTFDVVEVLTKGSGAGAVIKVSHCQQTSSPRSGTLLHTLPPREPMLVSIPKMRAGES